MANRIVAIRALCPRLDLDPPTLENRFLELVTHRTTLSRGVVLNVQESEIETLILELCTGRPVHTGTAIYSPSIGLDGRIAVNVRVDARIRAALNAAGAYAGRIANAGNIGKGEADLAAQWNALHPDDPVRP
jgi:hypothetical protein